MDNEEAKEMKSPIYSRVFILCILIFSKQLIAQQDTVVLSDTNSKYEFGTSTEILNDPSRTLTFEQVSSAAYNGHYKKGDQPILNFGYSSDDMWIRFRVKNTSLKTGRQWIIQAGNTFLSKIELYFIDASGAMMHKESGKDVPYNQREIGARSFLFHLDIKPGETKTIYIHSSGYDNRLYYAYVWDMKTYFDFLRTNDVLLSLYFGILLALAVYNLFLYFSIFDSSYLLYVLYITFTGTTHLIITGFGLEYIGNSGLIRDYYMFIHFALAFIFGTLFSYQFLNVPAFFPKAKYLLIGYITFVIILLVFQFSETYNFMASQIVSVIEIIGMIIILYAAIVITRKGYRPARYYLIGWSFLLVGAISMILKHMGYIPVTTFTQWIMKVGVAFEALVLSMGLADRFNRIRLELHVKSLEAQRLIESGKIKSHFFSNISHEFRTPLSLIISPLEKMIKEKRNEANKDLFMIMHRNASRLMQLVSQLLDLSKLDSKSMKLNFSEKDPVHQTRLIASYFDTVASEKLIHFQCTFPEEQMRYPLDEEKLEIIVSNLLSNAFKFTKAGGTVLMDVTYSYGDLVLSVSDTGIGISADQIDKIFDRFYQVSSSSSREYEGTGIGLSLVKELIELHHGTISVKSTPETGTAFTVRLPLGIHHYKMEEFHWKEVAEYKDGDALLRLERQIETIDQLQDEKQRAVVLLIEDNEDFRFFTKSVLQKHFDIIESINGESGWEKALEYTPDLIVADLMMPVMDGIQLTRKIKEDIRTSHIPVILLTAKQALDTKLTGLENGADDYLTKPFQADELLIRIKNLIRQREKLREVFQKDLWVRPEEQALPTANEKFLILVTKSIEENLASGEFNVEQLGKEIGMSRTQIFKKFKALTGLPPSEFIKQYKLNKAMQLLQNKTFVNIAEVAYSCGFSSPSHFTESFRKHFGKSPSAFIKELTQAQKEQL